MIKQTWIFRDGRIVPKPEKAPLETDGAFFMPDIRPFVTQEGTLIASRSHLRAYETARGVRQVGTDLNGEIARIKEKLHGNR